MIIKAAEHLERNDAKHPFKFFLVDEFQDMSPGRARLIKALLRQHEDSVLFGVGDDWQAINGFAGSDLQAFLNFKEQFGPTWEGKLSKTYRCAQGIAEVGAWFVMENKSGQKPKNVTSEVNKQTNGLVDLLDLQNEDETESTIEQRLAELAKSFSTAPTVETKTSKISVFILGRYQLDNMKEVSKTWLDALKTSYSLVLDIQYMTMHKSKGLEADYVFVVGLNTGRGLSFPSAIEEDPLVNMLLVNEDQFPHAEERRLFYVAITRARHKVFLLFRRDSVSPFVLELMDGKYEQRVLFRGDTAVPSRCPACKRGFLLEREGGQFLGCTRYKPERGCKHKDWPKPLTLRMDIQSGHG
jgi:DNA helicase-4